MSGTDSPPGVVDALGRTGKVEPLLGSPHSHASSTAGGDSSSSSSSSDSDSDSEDSLESGDSDFGGGYSSGAASAGEFEGSDDDVSDGEGDDADSLGGGASPIRSIVPGNATKSEHAGRVAFTNIAGVRVRLAEMIADTCDILALDAAHVEMFLLYYKWNSRTLQEQWFDSPEKVRQKCGFLSLIHI